MKNKFGPIHLVLLAVALLLSVYNYWWARKTPASIVLPQNSRFYDRIIKTSELKVGYLILPPYLGKSTSSGQLSGIFYDVVEEMGRRLHLKINWVEEVNLATLSEGIDNGRYDMIGFPLWRSSERVKKVAFSTPLFYSTVGCYARVGDNRFDTSLNPINATGITVSTIDGELAESIAKNDFPKASLVALPPLADYSQMLLQVASKKADVTFHNRVFAARYIKSNPGTIKEVTKVPIRVFAECFILPTQDYQLQTMINETVAELIENGFINKAFRDNGENPDEYYMTSLPYKIPKND